MVNSKGDTVYLLIEAPSFYLYKLFEPRLPLETRRPGFYFYNDLDPPTSNGNLACMRLETWLILEDIW